MFSTLALEILTGIKIAPTLFKDGQPPSSKRQTGKN